MKDLVEKLMLGAIEQKLNEAFLDGMREAAALFSGQSGIEYRKEWVRQDILEEVARRAKSGNVRQKTGLAERSDAEASATPSKQGDAS